MHCPKKTIDQSDYSRSTIHNTVQAARAYTLVQDQEILPNKVGGPLEQRCKKDLCRQRILLVPRTRGIQSGGGVAAVQSNCPSSVARICKRKRLGVPNNGKIVAPWWNQEVKDEVPPKKVTYKAWLRHKTNLLCMRATLRCVSPQFSPWKTPKFNLVRISDIN